MAATRKRPHQKEKQPERPVRDTLIIAIIAATAPLILAFAELLKTGHALGWW